MSTTAEILVPRDEQRALSTIEMLTQAAQQAGVGNAVQLFELLERAEKREAEKAFIAAFARLKFPAIKKLAKGQNNTKYAAWDHVQEIITPILEGEGFTLIFGSGHITDKGMVPIEATLSHVGGHKETRLLELPMDKSGQMTAIQGGGSTFSYGKRYAAGMILNLRFVGEDDDGAAVGQISERERDSIEDILNEIGDEHRVKFLEFIGFKSVGDIQKGTYRAAINYLVAKRRQLAEKAK